MSDLATVQRYHQRSKHALNAYAAAGIRSDHEMSTIEAGRERLRAGMWVLIREASAARNLHALLPLVSEFGPHRLAFCTDDREPEHIAEEGHVNSMVRAAVTAGVSPEDAPVMAAFNPAQWHGLRDLGVDLARVTEVEGLKRLRDQADPDDVLAIDRAGPGMER